MGVGFGGQFLYIDPAKRLVIVQLTTNPAYDSSKTMAQTLAVYRAIGASLH
ncbi:hypothetical protein D9M69_730520 [compost metagenome]